MREHGLYEKSFRTEKSYKAAPDSRAQAAVDGYSEHSESAAEGHQLTGSRDRALLAAQAAASKKAQDVLILDVAELIGITDYFVICSGSNERQVATVVDEVEKRLRDRGVKPYRREGEREHRWVLLDYVDIVVHVFHTQEREFYELERLWKDAGRVEFEDEAAAAGG
ncbi:MAG: ribosome silencing factor [Actinomycetota bacterium]